MLCGPPGQRGNHVIAGSNRYISPEVRRGEGLSPAADVWSFGATLWEMALRRQFPSRDAGVSGVQHRGSSRAGGNARQPRWKRLLFSRGARATQTPNEVCRIICDCLQPSPSDRPLMSTIFFEFLYLVDDV